MKLLYPREQYMCSESEPPPEYKILDSHNSRNEIIEDEKDIYRHTEHLEEKWDSCCLLSVPPSDYPMSPRSLPLLYIPRYFAPTYIESSCVRNASRTGAHWTQLSRSLVLSETNQEINILQDRSQRYAAESAESHPFPRSVPCLCP